MEVRLGISLLTKYEMKMRIHPVQTVEQGETIRRRSVEGTCAKASEIPDDFLKFDLFS